jgi:hypothetical protein
MAARSLLVVALILLSACLWRSYGDVMTVHLEVLSAEAAKLADNAQAGERPTSNDMTELAYPLQRARQFAYQYRSYGERESYRLFTAALDRYQALSEAVDAARGDEGRWAEERSRLAAQYAAWRSAADEARAALARGA